MHWYLHEIYDISDIGSTGVTCTALCDQIDNDVATMRMRLSLVIPSAWWDEHYPGSLGCIAAALAIGVDAHEIPALVMANEVLMSVELPACLDMA